MKSAAGLSFIEVLIVVGLLALIFAIGVPITLDFYLDYQLTTEARFLVAALRQARNLSLANHNESDHGVYINLGQFVVFQGNNYASREILQDNVFPHIQAISVLGPTELIFEGLSGRTASSTFSLSDGRKNKFIYVNEEGAISY